MTTVSGYPCCEADSLCPQHLQQLQENERTAEHDMLTRRSLGATRFFYVGEVLA